jgi:DNA-binding NtrC family response regulator
MFYQSMKGTILVVEDDVDLIEIYREILQMHEFDVQTASNGKEGVKKFIEFKPYLVIMDGDMPIQNGYQSFKQIKEIDNKANVIIVTGYSEFDPKNVEAIKQGLIKIIPKPLGVNQLLDLAKKYNQIKVEK